MEETLTNLGLNKKEVKFYLALLQTPQQTPANLAKSLGETRVNSYAILESLQRKGLVIKKEASNKYVFAAENPTKLKELLNQKAQEVNDTQKQLQATLPSLISQYKIAQNKPGVLYLEGVDNLKLIYDDIVNDQSDLAVFPALPTYEQANVRALIQASIKRQKKAGIHTRVLFEEATRSVHDVKALARNNIQVRFWEAEPQRAQILIFGNQVAITTFDDGVFSTVITDETISKTLLMIFDETWRNAKP